jgi:hypothetical protein
MSAPVSAPFVVQSSVERVLTVVVLHVTAVVFRVGVFIAAEAFGIAVF